MISRTLFTYLELPVDSRLVHFSVTEASDLIPCTGRARSACHMLAPTQNREAKCTVSETAAGRRSHLTFVLASLVKKRAAHIRHRIRAQSTTQPGRVAAGGRVSGRVVNSRIVIGVQHDRTANRCALHHDCVSATGQFVAYALFNLIV